MTTISHIMIGATITAIFSIYTILNICEYVTTHVLETEKNLVIYYDYKIKELNKTIDLLTEKVNLLESTNKKTEEKDIDICDIYNSEQLDFSCEQILLNEKVVVEDVNKDKEDKLVVEDVVENVVEKGTLVVEDVIENIIENILKVEDVEIEEDYDDIPDLINLDDNQDAQRVKDSLLVIARKILIGV